MQILRVGKYLWFFISGDWSIFVRFGGVESVLVLNSQYQTVVFFFFNNFCKIVPRKAKNWVKTGKGYKGKPGALYLSLVNCCLTVHL
jgi:hypothetical protein